MKAHVTRQGVVGPLHRDMQQEQKLKKQTNKQTPLQVCFGPWFLLFPASTLLSNDVSYYMWGFLGEGGGWVGRGGLTHPFLHTLRLSKGEQLSDQLLTETKTPEQRF